MKTEPSDGAPNPSGVVLTRVKTALRLAAIGCIGWLVAVALMKRR